MPTLLDEMRASLGVQEIKGPGTNSEVAAYFSDCGWKLAELGDDDTVAWCAARLGSALKRCGYPVPPKAVNLTARTYATYGVAAAPGPGRIAVVPRGNAGWQGHVVVIEEVLPNGSWQTIGGNQGREGYGKVSRAIVDPRKVQVLGVRAPVEASVPALRKAGSTEIKKGDQVQKLGIFATFFGPIIAALKELFGAATQVPQFADLPEQLTWWHTVIGGTNAVGRLVLEHPWLAGTTIAGIVLAWVGHTIKKHRVAKAAAGAPLSSQMAENAPPEPVGGDLQPAMG